MQGVRSGDSIKRKYHLLPIYITRLIFMPIIRDRSPSIPYPTVKYLRGRYHPISISLCRRGLKSTGMTFLPIGKWR